MAYIRLQARLSRAREVLDSYGLPFRWEPNSPATTSQIELCETKIGFPLPPSHRSFLLLANGVRLDIAFDYKILSTDQIVEVTDKMRSEDYNGEDVGNLIACVTYNSDCDRLVLDPERRKNGEYAVLDAFHEEGPSGWKMAEGYVAPSFEGWLSRTLRTVGLRRELPEYWIVPGKPIRELAEAHKHAIEAQKRADLGFRL